eukprot:m.30284 g.30284  ORF g.30284 m.30284 type:complete len:365 (+) comp16251_c0_seq1:219-1313(+)
MSMYGNKEGTPWLHGLLKRPEVAKLIPKVDGSFLVRDSTRRAGDFVLSVYLSGKVQHFVIEAKGGMFGIDDGPKYGSLPELVDFYKNHPDSPTRLTDAVLRPGEKPAFNPRAKKLSAPPPLPTEPEAPSGFDNLDEIYSDKPEDRPPLPHRQPNPSYSVSVRQPEGDYGNKEVKSTAAKKEMTEAEKEAEKERKKELQRIAREAIAALKMDEASIDTPQGADVAYERERQFQREAMMTEALNIWWINTKLKEIGGSAQVTDVKESMKSGAYIMQVLAHLSGRKAPRYSQKPKMAVQFKDNWVAIVAFMRDLGIQVDKDKISGAGEDTEVDVSLNADLLGDMDRREHLKLFTKVMLYENFLKRDQ